MTKLRSKLQQLAKKRAHRKTVQKRKVERTSKEMEAKKRADEARLEAMVEQDMLRLSDPTNTSADQNVTELSSSDKKLVAGIVMSRAPATKKGVKKQLTRKQLRRKEKIIEKGSAITEQIKKKWSVKKMRVKSRAQIRNENLHN